MACDIIIRITTSYDKNTGDPVTEDITIAENALNQDETLTIDLAAAYVSMLSDDDRKALIDKLSTSLNTQLKMEDIESGIFASNITLQGLLDKFPGLDGHLNIDPERMSRYKILYRNHFSINGHNYSGRVIMSNGEEMYIITNKLGAYNFVRSVQAMERAIDVFEGGETGPEKLTDEMLSDLKAIAAEKKLSMADTVRDYLTNKSAYKKAITVDGHTIRTGFVMDNICAVLANDYEAFKTQYTELEHDLFMERSTTKSSTESWVIARSKLYSILSDYSQEFANRYDKEAFNKLTGPQLDNIIKELGIFRGNPKLERAKIKQIYMTGSTAYVGISFSYNQTLSDMYGFGWDKAESIPSPVNEGPVVNGRCNGMYLYKIMKDGHQTYVLSWDIVAPGTIAGKTYKSLDEAIRGAQKSLDRDAIKSYARLEFIANESGDVPRTVACGESKVHEGQILTVPNTTLPSWNYSQQYKSVKDMLSMTVPKFIAAFNDTDGSLRLPAIAKLRSPRLAGLFIARATKVLTKQDYDSVPRSTVSIEALVDLMCNESEKMNAIIDEITAPDMSVIHYQVETINTNHTTNRRTAFLKLLRHGGTDIGTDVSTVGGMSTGAFIGLTLKNAVDFFRDTYGIKVQTMSSSQLKDFSTQHELGIESRVDGVKGFIYDGVIYLNTSAATIKDLYHEISHLYMGMLKVAHPGMFQKLLDHYMRGNDKNRRNRAMDMLRRLGAEYNNMAQTDLEEEVVARLIASELYKDSKLSLDGFNGSEYERVMDDVAEKVGMFTKENPDNGLSFGTLMRDLKSRGGELKKRRQLTNFIRQQIEAGNTDGIIENCD